MNQSVNAKRTAGPWQSVLKRLITCAKCVPVDWQFERWTDVTSAVRALEESERVQEHVCGQGYSAFCLRAGNWGHVATAKVVDATVGNISVSSAPVRFRFAGDWWSCHVEVNEGGPTSLFVSRVCRDELCREDAMRVERHAAQHSGDDMLPGSKCDNHSHGHDMSSHSQVSESLTHGCSGSRSDVMSSSCDFDSCNSYRNTTLERCDGHHRCTSHDASASQHSNDCNSESIQNNNTLSNLSSSCDSAPFGGRMQHDNLKNWGNGNWYHILRAGLCILTPGSRPSHTGAGIDITSLQQSCNCAEKHVHDAQHEEGHVLHGDSSVSLCCQDHYVHQSDCYQQEGQHDYDHHHCHHHHHHGYENLHSNDDYHGHDQAQGRSMETSRHDWRVIDADDGFEPAQGIALGMCPHAVLRRAHETDFEDEFLEQVFRRSFCACAVV
jgi:hypothetical protein